MLFSPDMRWVSWSFFKLFSTSSSSSPFIPRSPLTSLFHVTTPCNYLWYYCAFVSNGVCFIMYLECYSLLSIMMIKWGDDVCWKEESERPQVVFEPSTYPFNHSLHHSLDPLKHQQEDSLLFMSSFLTHADVSNPSRSNILIKFSPLLIHASLPFDTPLIIIPLMVFLMLIPSNLILMLLWNMNITSCMMGSNIELMEIRFCRQFLLW